MITFDFETKSYADLVKVGTWAYSEDPTTDVICCAYGIDDDPIQTWWPGKDVDYSDPISMKPGAVNLSAPGMPHDLQKAMLEGHLIEAHNVAFERSIWANVMSRYGWVLPYKDKWRDTMAVACYYALPAALNKLAQVLGFGGKDPEGGRLITKYSKLYLKTAKTEIPDEDFEKFVAYCVKDIEIEKAVSDFLGDLPDRELPIFLLDQKINLRGLHLDTEGIRVASSIVSQRSDALAKEFRKLTGVNPTQTAKVLEWFKGEGLPLDNLQAGYLQEVIEDGEVPSGKTRTALDIRLQINKASTKKLDAMSRTRGVDSRSRFQTRYHGAATGRWTGSGFQPLNLNKGFEGMDPTQLVRDIMYGDAEWLDTLYGDAMDAVAKASRHWIMAAPGNKIISGDFVSIEAVILSCLAGEQWKIDAFREGVKLYELMADKIYGLPPGTVTKATHPTERFDGKTAELACLGASTQVLTPGGWKSIIKISSTDKLWDGQTWVAHGGLIAQGNKRTIQMKGVSVTADHLVMVGSQWLTAREVALSESILNQALETGLESLPLSATREGRGEDCWLSGSSVLAAQNSTLYRKLILGTEELLGVIGALKGSLGSGVKTILDTLTFAPTMLTAVAYSVAFPLASPDVSRGAIKTTEPEAYEFGSLGATAPKVEGHIWNICLRWMAGINRSLRLTALTPTKDMSRAIFGLLREAKTQLIKDKYTSCNDELTNLKPVYDIANAGPQNRFTILTDDGPIIVHNCGYQGALGAWLKFDSSGRHTDEKIIEIVKAWRTQHPAIVAFWGKLQRAAIKATRDGQLHRVGQIGFEVVDEWLTMILPSGKRIWYWKPIVSSQRPNFCNPLTKPDCTDGICGHDKVPTLSYMAMKTGQWKRVSTFGGKLAENSVQATSRELLVPAMLRVEEEGYPIVLSVYDEIVVEVAEDFGSADEFKEIMAGPLPEWAEGWPISVDAWEGDRYRK